MSANNGRPTPAEYREKLAQAEVAVEKLRAEQARIDHQVESYTQHLEELKEEAARAGVATLAEGGVRRSKLSAKQKSDLIDQLGPAGYLALPYDDPPREEAAPRRPTWSPNWQPPR